MPIDDQPDFMRRIRLRPGLSARVLKFTILTAARSGEALGTRWSEIDLARALWIVPAERMKGGRMHRVPLSSAALAVLQPLREASFGDLVFPGMKPGTPLSNMSMDKILRLERLDITVHGFRSTFKDWATERTNFSHELSEAALAHAIRDKTDAAYRRGDMMDKRREMMEAWARFCLGDTAT